MKEENQELYKSILIGVEEVLRKSLDRIVENYHNKVKAKSLVGKSSGTTFSMKVKFEETAEGTSGVVRCDDSVKYEWESEQFNIQKDLDLVDENNQARDFRGEDD